MCLCLWMLRIYLNHCFSAVHRYHSDSSMNWAPNRILECLEVNLKQNRNLLVRIRNDHGWISDFLSIHLNTVAMEEPYLLTPSNSRYGTTINHIWKPCEASFSLSPSKVFQNWFWNFSGSCNRSKRMDFPMSKLVSFEGIGFRMFVGSGSIDGSNFSPSWLRYIVLNGRRSCC